MVTAVSSMSSMCSPSAIGGSFKSSTVIVTVTVSKAFELSLALTVTVCEGAVS